ncbi:MAG: twin-arginine translocase subunit TatB [Alphaproteobacteria bacterium]|nr:twin-arginine translocase subunit TatB [Alphaproteobacteria bacterium]
MLDWNELLIIGAAALIFIGPKELPGTLRTLGKFVAKARTMAREFQTNVDDMVREAELDEVKKQVQKLEYGGLERMVQETVDPKGQLSKALEAPDLSAPSLSAPAATPAAPAPAAPAAAAAAPTAEAAATTPKA